MKDFRILKYLSKGRWLIFIVSLLGVLGVYYYTSSNQEYSSTTAIRYANQAASEGLAPNGSKIDVSEIYSSSVIKGAIEDLGLNCSIESIRSKVKVESIIPEEEEQKKENALDKGEDYDYFPSDYKITFTANSNASKDYAHDVLDVILKRYYRFYSEKYADLAILPNNSINVISNDYDYIDSTEIIENSVKSIDDYLLSKAQSYPEFRSSATGYTFVDLANIYNYYRDVEIPGLYSSILEGKYTKDNNVLVKKQQDKIDNNNLTINNLTDKSKTLRELIANYSQKEINSINHDADGGTLGNSQIIDNVEAHKDSVIGVTTTYDELIGEYVLINQEIKYNEIDRDHSEYIKSIYKQNTANTVLNEDIDDNIKDLVDKLNQQYEIVHATATELNDYIGASYLKPLNSITSSEKINVKLYLTLAFALFFVVGCVGSIIIGRIIEFVEYFLYTDKKTKLPNRQMCDRYINVHGKEKLKDDFSVAVILITSLQDINKRLGYEVGDTVLEKIGQILKECGKDYGFVGYNGSNQFVAMFEKCDISKCESFIARLENAVAKYNEDNVDKMIKYTLKYVNSQKESIYDIRKLIAKAFGSIN